MKGANAKIFISVIVGILVLLGGYLLIDLNVIDFKKDKEPEPTEVIDNDPIGPSIDDVVPISSENETDLNETNETEENETEEDNETTTPVEPPKPDESTSNEPVQNDTNTNTNDKITFSSNSITCYAGGKVYVDITVTADKNVGIDSYSTSNDGVFSIGKYADVKTNNKKKVTERAQITCNATGRANINVVSKNGKKASLSVTVINVPNDKVTLSKTSISCTAGETINITAVVEGYNDPIIKSYTSSNNSVATITKSSTQPKCVGLIKDDKGLDGMSVCMGLDVNCIGQGSATINVESSKGVKAAASVSVSKYLGTVSFEKDSFTCKEGESFVFLVTATSDHPENGIPSVTGVTSGNSSLVAISTPDVQTDCYNCTAYKATCIKAGTATLTATNSFGARASVNVTVNKVDSSITFSPTSISCTAGQTKSVLVKFSPLLLNKYTVADTSVATVSKSSIQTNCAGCISLDINCKKKGSTTLDVSLKNDFSNKLNIIVN